MDGGAWKSQLFGKGSDAEKDWRQREKGAEENEMVDMHHLLNECEFSKLWETEQGSLAWPMEFQRVRQDLATNDNDSICWLLLINAITTVFTIIIDKV